MIKISQSQIREYDECPRKYYLKHIRKLSWPYKAEESDLSILGSQFHALVQQSINGVDPYLLESNGLDGKIGVWFSNFRSCSPLRGFDEVSPEITLSSFYKDVLLYGKLDVLAIKDNEISIFDWKTTGKRISDSFYRNSPQTRLYMLLAKRSAVKLTGIDDIPSENIRMVYWFPQFPDNPAAFVYSDEQYKEDLLWFDDVLFKMRNEHEALHPETNDILKCNKCMFCGFCRGAAPEFVEDEVDEVPFNQADELYNAF